MTYSYYPCFKYYYMKYTFDSVFKPSPPQGCVAGYKLDDDISFRVEHEQNVMLFFEIVSIQIIPVTRLTDKSNNASPYSREHLY